MERLSASELIPEVEQDAQMPKWDTFPIRYSQRQRSAYAFGPGNRRPGDWVWEFRYGP